MRLGAHVSISGSLDLAVDRAQALGCDCLQIFYGSPRQWRTIAYPDETMALFREKRDAAHLDPFVAHGAYLVNLAAPDRAIRRRSIASLLATTRGVERLGGLGAITHLGSRLGAPRGQALKRIAASVREILNGTHRVMVLLENSAGSGDSIGAMFEDFGDLLDLLDGEPRVGACLDTAHLFAAGWDLRSRDGVDAMVAAFDRAAGWERVRVLHLNDSRAPLGARVDRHENIGAGHIGVDGFRAIVTHPRLRLLPGIIETPGFDRQGPDRRNLARLRRLRGDRQAGRAAAAATRRRRVS